MPALSVPHHLGPLRPFIVPPFQPHPPEPSLRALGIAGIEHPSWRCARVRAVPGKVSRSIVGADLEAGRDVAVTVVISMPPVGQIIDFDCGKVALNCTVVDWQDFGRWFEALGQGQMPCCEDNRGGRILGGSTLQTEPCPHRATPELKRRLDRPGGNAADYLGSRGGAGRTRRKSSGQTQQDRAVDLIGAGRDCRGERGGKCGRKKAGRVPDLHHLGLRLEVVISDLLAAAYGCRDVSATFDDNLFVFIIRSRLQEVFVERRDLRSFSHDPRPFGIKTLDVLRYATEIPFKICNQFCPVLPQVRLGKRGVGRLGRNAAFRSSLGERGQGALHQDNYGDSFRPLQSTEAARDQRRGRPATC